MQEHADDARLSRELSTLRADVPIEKGWESLEVREPDRERLRGLYERLGFTRLLDALDADADSGSQANANPDSSPSSDRPSASVPIEILRDEASLGVLGRRLADSGQCAMHAVTSEGSAVSRRLIGLALASPDAPTTYLAISGDGLFPRWG